jgi:hypothetical protein
MEPLKLIKITSQGDDVARWQFFLRGLGLYENEVTGVFDEATKNASIAFQKQSGLQPDGVVGNKTYGAAMQHGFSGIEDNRTDKTGAAFPPKPSFDPLLTNEQRQQLFGTFTFVSDPIPGNPENIRVTNNWANDNITIVHIPQLVSIKGNDRMQFHKRAANQLVKLWSDWEQAGLLHLVLTWDGSYVPRFIRGSRTTLSNHSFGTAFDINVQWNQLGAEPALVGQKGSVRELVPIANDNGFYWGGHFKRLDGMHFEIAKIV